jgi:hypothetical protein
MRPVGLVRIVRQILYQIEMHGFIYQKSSSFLRNVSHYAPLGNNYTVPSLWTLRRLAMPAAPLPGIANKGHRQN